MKKMIILTDFSQASENASLYAIELAREFDATVTLVHVTPPSAIVHDSMFASIMITQAEIIQENRNSMDKKTNRLSEINAQKIYGIVKEGYVYDIVSSMVTEEKVDLVVMGMKGKGMSNSVFGSTTTTLIRKSNFPILLIPGETKYKGLERITYAADFDTSIEMDTFSILVKFAEKFSAPLSILHVAKNDRFTSNDALGKLNASMQLSRLQPEFHTILDSDVIHGINQFLEKYPCSLLAMVAHQHTIIQRVFGKVYTKEMSLQTKVPLLVL